MRTTRQLALLDEIARVAADADIDCWVRGGWALDLFVGRVTRPHGDIDLFLWAEDAERFAGLLREHGHYEVGGPPRTQQRNFVKDGTEIHVGLLRRERSGEVVVAGGPAEGAPWPEGMLADDLGAIGDVRCRIISPRSQLEIKERFPEWTGRPPREWDAADIAVLRDAIGA